jgi:ABC-type proline/glycine betaine transport system substrate-binding protein
MAYMNQEKKQKIQNALKPILAKYGVKGTLKVRNHHAISLTLRSGPIDFIGDLQVQRTFGYTTHQIDKDKMRERYELSVNQYWIDEHYTGVSLEFLKQVKDAMMAADYYDRSDAQIDYFDTAYYYDISVGSWNKPYTLTK